MNRISNSIKLKVTISIYNYVFWFLKQKLFQQEKPFPCGGRSVGRLCFFIHIYRTYS